MQIFSVTLGTKEFSVIGVANVAKKTASFQATLNGVPFAQHEDYQLVRQWLLDAVAINQPNKNPEAN